MLAFLDVRINNKDPSCLLASLHPRNTFTLLLNNFFSFSSFSYKIGLIRILVDRAYKINFFLKHLHSIITIKLQLYTSLIKGSVKLAVSTSVDNVLTVKRK